MLQEPKQAAFGNPRGFAVEDWQSVLNKLMKATLSLRIVVLDFGILFHQDVRAIFYEQFKSTGGGGQGACLPTYGSNFHSSVSP